MTASSIVPSHKSVPRATAALWSCHHLLSVPESAEIANYAETTATLGELEQQQNILQLTYARLDSVSVCTAKL